MRQYLPVEFGWDPKGRKKAAIRTYSKSLSQDNYWCVAPTDEGAVWWFLDGDCWTEPLVTALDRCMERMVYFGRAETFNRIRRVRDGFPQPNCDLSENRGTGSVPVLVPAQDATPSDVERVTDDDENAKRSVPIGARVMYALRPARPTVHELPEVRFVRSDIRLFQLALGWNVAPTPRAIVRLAARFRGAVLRALLQIKTRDNTATWSRVDGSVREAIAYMSGKDALGKPLTGHQHAEFFAWYEDGIPTRLMVWRGGRPFDVDEQTAILRAASHELSWTAAGSNTDVWKVRLIPLDRAVPPPPGFDGASSCSWESVTPYVPPRHNIRGGRSRDRESLIAQIRRELILRGFEGGDKVEIKQVGSVEWVAVHVPRTLSAKRSFLGDRRGYLLCLTFSEPIQGPLRLGHSSSFGLGLFKPVDKP